MPYVVDKSSKCVYKKKSDGSKGEKVGCTKGDLQKYVAALHANVDERKKTVMEIRQAFLKESNIVEAKVNLANNIEFYVVEKSKRPDDNPMELMYKADPLYFANQIRGGLLPEDIQGFYLSEDEALDAAHDQVAAVFEAAKRLEEKKHKVTDKIQKKISTLQKQMDAHLKAAKSDPAAADDHEAKAEAILSDIKELRAKHGLVEKSKTALPEKEKDEKGTKEKLEENRAGKKKLKEDHEVSMAQNSLQTLMDDATELMSLLGGEEKDIPAWIQDHIAKAENYLQQASANYHEYSQTH